MSLPLRLLIAFVVWLIFYLLTYNGCQNELCFACDESRQEATGAVGTQGDTTLTAEVRDYPLYFQWGDPKAYTNEDFDALRREVLNDKTENNILEVTGMYFEEEPKPEGFDNLGFARAEQVRELLEAGLPEDRIRIRARTMDEEEGVREQPFEAVGFDWIEPEETVAETVEELDDRIIIRFPFGSTEKEYDPAVDEYLDKLAERVKETGESVSLTGHTDNVGSAEANQQLAMERARAIKQILVRKGVPSDQATTISKGETQPVASNETEEGQYENRRVEVRLIKQQ